MLMPLERMRVGISSESASQTHTPGPMRKKRHENKEANGHQPAVVCAGHGRDQRVFNFQRSGPRRVKIGERVREKGHDLVGREHSSSRVISTGLAAASSERATCVAARKSP